METRYVFFAVRTEFLNATQASFGFIGLIFKFARRWSISPFCPLHSIECLPRCNAEFLVLFPPPNRPTTETWNTQHLSCRCILSIVFRYFKIFEVFSLGSVCEGRQAWLLILCLVGFYMRGNVKNKSNFIFNLLISFFYNLVTHILLGNDI
jgi:hypothetical protein